MKRLSNTCATNQLAQNIQNLCYDFYDGAIWCDERHGYIFVQLASVGHKSVRLQFDRSTQSWTLTYDLENVYHDMHEADIINFIQTH